jgi:hypothetical protein
MFPHRETEQYAKREEVWNQIEELARKKNPQFENLINQMDYLSLSQNNNDFTLNEDDFSSDKLDQYSKDVSRNEEKGLRGVQNSKTFCGSSTRNPTRVT